MASTPSFNWATPDNTALVKNGALDIRTLGNAIDSSMSDLLGGTTGQVLKKNSNTDMDFVWSADSAGMTNPMTTTGDTIYSSSGSTPARLGIGSTGQVLTVAGGVPTWASPAGGGGKILQVLQQTYSTATSNGTETYADTGITLSITPTASTSKVLIFVTVAGMYRSANDCSARFQILRGATSIHEFEKNIMNSGGTANQSGSTGSNYLDSPATTSATTYKVQFRRNPASGGTIYINLSDSISTITLMEVGA